MLDIMLKAESKGTLDGSGDAKRNDFWTSDEDEADELVINDVWE